MRERVWHGAGVREVKGLWEGARTWEGRSLGGAEDSLICIWDGAGAWDGTRAWGCMSLGWAGTGLERDSSLGGDMSVRGDRSLGGCDN